MKKNQTRSDASRLIGLVFLVSWGFLDCWLTSYIRPYAMEKVSYFWWGQAIKPLFFMGFFLVGGLFSLLIMKFVGNVENWLRYKGWLFEKPSEDQKSKWVCPKCAKSNSDRIYKCSSCGYHIV